MRQIVTWGLGVLIAGMAAGCAGAGGNGQATTRYSGAVPGEERQSSSWSARGGRQQSRPVTVAVYSEEALAVNGKPCRRDELLERLRRLDSDEVQLQADPGCPANTVAQIVGWLGQKGYTVYLLPAEEVRIEYN